MSESTLIAIAALFCTSCLVRIIPAFLSFQMSEGTRGYFERILPAAVFLNFAVYIAYTEVTKAPLAALISLLAVGTLASLNFLGLVSTAAIATCIYFLLVCISGY